LTSLFISKQFFFYLIYILFLKLNEKYFERKRRQRNEVLTALERRDASLAGKC